tara:strand:+ start:10171 stop:10719 length:549 start_codon:yes stop_codon:yes gene_type:complete
MRACKRLAKHCPLTPDEVAWFAPKRMHKLMDTGKISKKKLYQQAVKNLGLKNITQKRFEEIYANIFTSNKPVQDLVKKLSKNYKLLLLSNTDDIHFTHVKKKFPILKLFKHLIVSYEVGYVKPSKQIYEEALKKSGFAAKECVFIDDHKENVPGAKKLGIKGLHYTTAAKLKKDLKSYGAKF